MSRMGLVQSLFLVGMGQRQVAHVCRIPHESVRLCSGVIPPEYASRYKDLYLRQVMQRDMRKGAADQLDGAIVDLQDSAVSAISPVFSSSQRAPFLFLLSSLFICSQYYSFVQVLNYRSELNY